MWTIFKTSGLPFHPSLTYAREWPNTITQLLLLRKRYDSYQELSEPVPQEHWDYPHLVREHIDKLYPSRKNKKLTSIEINSDDVE